MKTINFTKARLPFGWMGNMSAFPVTFNGIIFPTSEHLFMWGRIKDEFAHIKARIPFISNPMEAKRFVKAQIKENPLILKHQMLSDSDVQWMKEVVRLKLQQHPSLLNELLQTVNAFIVEDVTARCNINSSDFFWGAAECLRDNVDGIEPFWVGKNTLGNIFMQLRCEFLNVEFSMNNDLQECSIQKEKSNIIKKIEVLKSKETEKSKINDLDIHRVFKQQDDFLNKINK